MILMTTSANDLASRCIIVLTTMVWAGVIACVAYSTGKGVFGGYLPYWVPVTTVSFGIGSTLLTFLIALRVLVDRRERLKRSHLLALLYGFSIIGAVMLRMLAVTI